MSKLYYNYHQITGEYLAPAQEADESPAEQGVFHKPAYSTFKEPPNVGENQTAVYSNGSWTVLPDFRGKTVYSKTNGQPVEIKLLGHAPNFLIQTFDPMPSQTHTWDKELDKWVQDSDKADAIFANVKSGAYKRIDDYHTSSLDKLYGDYTNSERFTWSMKLSIANAIEAKQELDKPAIAFLNASGQNTDDKKNAWAALVVLRNSQFAYAVGMSDRHRTQARAIAKQATNATFLKNDLDKFFAECDKEIDSFLS